MNRSSRALVALLALGVIAGCDSGRAAPPAGDAAVTGDGAQQADGAIPDDALHPDDAAPPAGDAATDGGVLAPVGAACSAAGACAGGRCIPASAGFPGGYCTHVPCDLGAADTSCAPYGGDGLCVDIGDPGAPQGMCFDRCDGAAADCRAGYECVDAGVGPFLCLPAPECGNGEVEYGEECEPPNTATCSATCQGLGAAAIGAPCATAGDCTGDYCFTAADGWPAGYCAQRGCDLAAAATSCAAYGGDGYCLDVGDVGAPYGVCFDHCDPAAADCRSGYACEDLGGGLGGLCFPAPVCGNGTVEQGEECEPPNTASCSATCQGVGAAAIGAPCAAATDCAGDYCFTAADGWPAGYCAQRDCDLAAADTACAPYGGDGYCLDVGDPGAPYGACFDRCDPAASDCRTGYSCEDVGGGLGGLCFPAPVCGNGLVERGEECELPNTATCSATCQGLGAAAIGAACGSAADCAGNYCFPAAAGWPAGYCSYYTCDLAAATTSCAAAGGDGYCLDVGDPGEPFGMCFDRCDPAGSDCRTGYACEDMGGGLGGLCFPAPVCGNGLVEQGEECEPPSTASCSATCQGVGAAAIGALCTAATDCAGNYCFTEADDGFPGGYCSYYTCDLAAATTSCAAAGGDGYCLDVGDVGAPFGMCFDHCDPAASDCRAGYACEDLGGSLGGVCLPGSVCGNGVVEPGEECEPPDTATCTATCQGPGTAAVGAACGAAADCLGDTCFTPADGWPAGYCSQAGCNLAAPKTSCLPYGGDGLCVNVSGGSPFGMCFDRCKPAQPSCRTGYTCQNIGAGNAACLPL